MLQTPHGAEAHKFLTYYHILWGDWAQGVEYFKEFERGCRVSEQSIKLQPQLADAWFRHGRVLALALKHREAVEALEKGWELLPAGGYLQSVPAAVWLGESYRVIGECWG